MMRRSIFRFCIACVFLVAACAPVPQQNTARNSVTPILTLPPMNTFTATQLRRVSRSNATIANDFMALAFQLESGRDLPVLSRFEGPISIRVTGNAPASLAPDLNNLLARLRREARLSISQVAATQPANITIEVISGNDLQRLVPNAACFVAPRVSSWSEFRRTRRSGIGDWTTLTERKTMSIFLPGDVSPQEVRDCMHEELAQSLGPVNDLYHLADSVFNDDNFHTVLTGFDMLILRAFYAPELHSGMPPGHVAELLPGILKRLNPAGGTVEAVFPFTTPKAWKEALGTALGASGTSASRRNAAKRAVTIAQTQGWNDNRLAFSLFALGRLSLSSDGQLALSSFQRAGEIYGSNPNTKLHAAHVAVQMAAYSLSTGHSQAAIDLVNQNIRAAMVAENASLLAALLMIKAQALDALGKHQEARIIRLDSLGWARYGFGSEQAVRSHLAEIAALSPMNRSAKNR